MVTLFLVQRKKKRIINMNELYPIRSMKKIIKLATGILLVLFALWIGAGEISQRTFVNITSMKKPETIGQERHLKGIYLNSRSISVESTDRIIDDLKEHDFNAVVINVKNVSGQVTYSSQVDLAREIGAITGRLDIEKIVQKLHSRGIYAIARLTCFKDPKLAGYCCGGGAWADPDNSTAISYNVNLAREVSKLGFDEIQLDYIRYSDGPGKIGGEYSYRSRVISQFVKRVRSAIPAHVKLSVDVYGRTLWDWNSKNIDPIGQNLEYLQEHVDFTSPMIYPSHYQDPELVYDPYKLVTLALKVGNSRLDTTMRPFIQGFDRKVPKGMTLVQYIQEQLKALQESEHKGFLVWNPRSDYDSLWKAVETFNP